MFGTPHQLASLQHPRPPASSQLAARWPLPPFALARAPSRCRSLQDAAPPPPTRVATPQQLREAAARGDARIVVTEHLDFTTVDPLPRPPWGFNAGAIGLNTSVQSITVRRLPRAAPAAQPRRAHTPTGSRHVQGDCAGKPLPSGVALRLAPTGVRPCVIQIVEDGVDVTPNAPRSVALSRLYFQLKATPDTSRGGAAFLIHAAAALYLTDVYMEGESLESRGVDVQLGAVFLKGAPPPPCPLFRPYITATARVSTSAVP